MIKTNVIDKVASPAAMMQQRQSVTLAAEKHPAQHPLYLPPPGQPTLAPHVRQILTRIIDGAIFELVGSGRILSGEPGRGNEGPVMLLAEFAIGAEGPIKRPASCMPFEAIAYLIELGGIKLSDRSPCRKSKAVAVDDAGPAKTNT